MTRHTKAQSIQAIILAAGASSRFKTGRTKLIEKICGRAMVLYPTSIFVNLNIPTVMVVGFQKEIVEATVKEEFESNVTFVHQQEQRGTGHAIQCTRDLWSADTILVMNGDMPLVTRENIEKLIKKHHDADATISFATAHHCDPEAMYGRVIQGDDSIKIIEAKDFEGDLSEQCCINAGIYLIKRSFLENYLDKLQPSAVTKEWYITDLINIASANKLTVQTVAMPFDRIRGVNDFKELWAAEQIKKSEIIQHWMSNGVRFAVAHNVQIDWNVSIKSGTSIGSGAQLSGNTKIGNDCTIEAFSFLKNATIGDRTTVYAHTVIEKSEIGTDCFVGPFSFIHGSSKLHNNATIGSFVEVNRSEIGAFSKAKHLSYLGDTTIGQKVAIGAGLVTCNYDGTNKHKTVINDNAFIGGNNTIVAPVVIDKSAITAAGSTITENVPADALAIGRTRQINKEGYADKIRAKQTVQQFASTLAQATKTSHEQQQ